MKPNLIIYTLLLYISLVIFIRNNFLDYIVFISSEKLIFKICFFGLNPKIAQAFHQPRKLKVTAKKFLIEDG
jgi:hypothetical protein